MAKEVKQSEMNTDSAVNDDLVVDSVEKSEETDLSTTSEFEVIDLEKLRPFKSTDQFFLEESNQKPVDSRLGWLPISVRSYIPHAKPPTQPLAEPRPIAKTTGWIVAIAAIYALLAGAQMFDASLTSGLTPRGTHLAGQNIGGVDRDELTEVVVNLSEDISTQPFEITANQITATPTLADLGIKLDQDRTIESALDSDETGVLVLRPVRWAIRNLQQRSTSPLHYKVDEEQLSSEVTLAVNDQLNIVTEPSFDFVGDSYVAIAGQTGEQIAMQEISADFEEALLDGSPYQISLETEISSPTVSLEQAQALEDEVAAIASEPLLVSILDQEVIIEPHQMRDWFTTALDEDGNPDWAVRPDSALEDINRELPELGLESRNGTKPEPEFTVIDNRPILLPPAEDIECCDVNSPQLLKEALNSRATTAQIPTPIDFPTLQQQCKQEGRELANSDYSGERIRRATLQPRFLQENADYDALASLGVIEEVSSCTTSFAPGQGRVINIQNFADLMRGVVIEPGETLSLNEEVGQRTRARGFVEAGAIVDGVITDDNVGGGISQFITTFFNSAFFSGIDLVEYQSHSIYLDRYPEGLEATISWGGPEQVVRNSTDYGILVWTEHTATSVTVTFYSTRHLEVEAQDLVRFRTGEACTTVQVGRLIDGVEDQAPVTALYRDREGFNCNGQPTRAQQELEAERLAAELAAQQAAQPPVQIPGLEIAPAPPTVIIPPGNDNNRSPLTTADQVLQ